MAVAWAGLFDERGKITWSGSPHDRTTVPAGSTTTACPTCTPSVKPLRVYVAITAGAGGVTAE